MTVEAARAAMLAEVSALPAETVPLAAGVGRVLAADIAAIRDQPPFTNSSMDGWAVRSGDGAGNLRIVGESAAGHGYADPLKAGEAVRIFTGAALPGGADSVVIQEDATRDGDQVDGSRLHARRQHPQGRARFPCRRRPAARGRSPRSLAAVPGGLRRTRRALGPSPRRSSRSSPPARRSSSAGHARPVPDLRFRLAGPAGHDRGLGRAGDPRSGVRDQLDAVVEAMRTAEGELIVTVGGASVGDHDLVRAAG